MSKTVGRLRRQFRGTTETTRNATGKSRFCLELTEKRRRHWEAAADIANPHLERNMAEWLRPLCDAAAACQIAGLDPVAILQRALLRSRNIPA